MIGHYLNVYYIITPIDVNLHTSYQPTLNPRTGKTPVWHLSTDVSLFQHPFPTFVRLNVDRYSAPTSCRSTQRRYLNFKGIHPITARDDLLPHGTPRERIYRTRNTMYPESITYIFVIRCLFVREEKTIHANNHFIRRVLGTRKTANTQSLVIFTLNKHWLTKHDLRKITFVPSTSSIRLSQRCWLSKIIYHVQFFL